MGAVLVVGVLAACRGGEPTRVDIRSASVDPVRGASRLTVNADVELSGAMIEALNNGVDLVLQWQLELRRPGRWWDATLVADRRDLRLSYHSLSGRYLLSGLDEPRNFTTLDSLLTAIGRTSAVIGVTPPQTPAGESFWRLRARLDRTELPPPLRLPAWLSPAWRVNSPWHRWPQAPAA